MPLYLLMLAVQIGLAIHVAKTGRQLYWIFIIVFVPIVGAVAYVVVELLPDLRNDPRARRAMRRAGQTVNPGGERRALEDQLHVADTAANRAALAEHCLRDGDYDRAAGLYASCLTGVHQADPHFMFGLARAYAGQGKHAAVKRTLEELIQANPDFHSTDGHLLFATTLEALGEDQAALTEYEALAASYPGEEARLRYATLLIRLQRNTDARRVLDDMLRRAKSAPRYYREKERAWLDAARAAQAALGPG